MKRNRKWQLAIKRQRQNTVIVICGLLITSLLGSGFLIQTFNSIDIKSISFTSSRPLLHKCHCSKSSLIIFNHGECFFDQVVCYPGFTGEECNVKIQNETYRAQCPLDSRNIEWTFSLAKQIKMQCLKSEAAMKEWNTSCLFLCFYHRLTGTVQIPSIFWHKSLMNELDFWKANPMIIDDRLYEHVEGFNGYKTIPLKLNSIIEIGAGPFTQVQYLLTPFRFIEQITLIEPNALEYMKLNNCAYRGGYLRGHSITIIAQPIEALMSRRRQNRNLSKTYSALISINVVEHVLDALEYFRSLYDLLEDDGLLIFHERWYDYPQQGDCVLLTAEHLHPIRITKRIIDVFLSQFETISINLNRTKRQMHSPCFEQGIYFIGRKKSACA